MKYFMYFLVAIPWAIALVVVFLLAMACVSEECYVYGGFDLMMFSIIGLLFISAALWIQFFIMSLFRDWLPFKIKNDGNAKMVHFGWSNIPIIFYGLGFAYIAYSAGRWEGDLTFQLVALFIFAMTLFIMYQFPNIYIKNEFDGTNQQLNYFAIKFSGLVSKSVPFSSIKEIKTYKIEQKRWDRMGPRFFSRWHSYTVFLLHTIEIIYETEEAEDKNLILVRGRDLGGEETVKQIEAFIADSFAKGAQKFL